MTREKDLLSAAVKPEINVDKNLLANRTQEILGSTAKIVPSSISNLAQVANAINALKLKPSALDAVNKALNQLKINNSTLDSFTQVSKAFDSLKLKPSALDAVNKVLNQLKLNNSTLDSFTQASKAFDSLKLKNSALDGLAFSRPLNTISAVRDSTPHISIFDQKAENTIIASPSDIGLLIRDARKRKGLSQQQFADLAGVGRRFVSECEKGKPRLELGKVLQIASAAGIDIFAKKR